MERVEEIERNYSISCICFKTDLLTVEQRKEMMKRQMEVADMNSVKEVSHFSSLLSELACLWKDNDEVSLVCNRFRLKTNDLQSNIRKLAETSASLGSLRQEVSFSKAVVVMMEYVDLLTDKKADI